MPRRVLRLLLPLVAALVALAAGPALASADVQIQLLQGEQTVPVKRPGSTLQEAVAALVAGPTRAETRRGFRTYVPPTTVVRSITQVGSVVVIDLDQTFAEADEAADLRARVTQLALTATGFTGVKSVRLRILGGTPYGLSPGIDATQPITPASLRRPVVPPPKPPVVGGARPDRRRARAPAAARRPQLPAARGGRRRGRGADAVRRRRLPEVGGLGRDGIVGPQTKAALASAARPTPRTPGGGRRVEVLLDRQLALVVDGGRVVRTITVSSRRRGDADAARQLQRLPQEERSWSVPFSVWLPWASYFVGGIAFHEYPDVPPYAASHGCVRVPRYDAKWLYDQTPSGTKVIVLGSSA